MSRAHALALLGVGLLAPGCEPSAPPGDVATDDGGRHDGGRLDGAMLDAPVTLDAGPPESPLGAQVIEVIDSGHEFLEGPQWRIDEGDLLFTDIPRNEILRLVPPDAVSVYDDASANANGLSIDEDGHVVRCEHGGRRLARETAPGVWTTVVDRFEGGRFHSPNDLVIRGDGTIYFTDPPYGLGSGTRELDFNGLYRVAPDGSLSVEREGSLASRPNGIAITADASTLYVTDTAAGSVTRFSVASSGALSEVGVVSDEVPQADGMAVDVAGNLFVGTRDGVTVLSPSGEVWGLLPTDAAATNCAFGGSDRRTLYVTAGGDLYAVTGLRYAGVP